MCETLFKMCKSPHNISTGFLSPPIICPFYSALSVSSFFFHYFSPSLHLLFFFLLFFLTTLLVFFPSSSFSTADDRTWLAAVTTNRCAKQLRKVFHTMKNWKKPEKKSRPDEPRSNIYCAISLLINRVFSDKGYWIITIFVGQNNNLTCLYVRFLHYMPFL